MFVRKLYYDNLTGIVIRSSVSEGSIKITSTVEDVVVLGELEHYKEDIGLLGVKIWTSPDADVEDSFARATNISVDISAVPHKIVFDFTPIVPIEQPSADAEELLNYLNDLGGVDDGHDG